MSDSRLRRFVGGLGLGYLHTAATVVVGLWLTPYVLRHLGSHDYGLWLLGAQVLVYLSLLDLGVVALIPREVARTAGDRTALRSLIAKAARVVGWQLPFVAIAAALVVWLLPAEWVRLRWPLGIVVLVFVATFPVRIAGAALQGLQDLAYLGRTQIVAWAAGAAVTIAAIAADLQLFSLALGWVTTQLVQSVRHWRRLRTAFADAVPADLPRLSASDLKEEFGRSIWISVGQVAQVLLAGTDLVVVGWLLGPEAVVTYACTGKLLTLLANQPQMFMQMALPALSELRVSAARDHLFDVAKSMAQVMLLLSGGIVVTVLAVNAPFVSWWVGPPRFGGVGLTAVMLVTMLVRHVNVTFVYTMFCFGYERRLALTPVVDGAVGLVFMLLLVPRWGLHGAALGSLASLVLISLPANLIVLVREEGSSPREFLAPLLPWLFRFLSVLGGVTVSQYFWTPVGPWQFVPFAIAVGAIYLFVMLPVMTTPPLGPMLGARLQPWLSRVPGLARHLIGTADALAR